MLTLINLSNNSIMEVYDDTREMSNHYTQLSDVEPPEGQAKHRGIIVLCYSNDQAFGNQ